jgi:hypothetical protein
MFKPSGSLYTIGGRKHEILSKILCSQDGGYEEFELLGYNTV